MEPLIDSKTLAVLMAYLSCPCFPEFHDNNIFDPVFDLGLEEDMTMAITASNLLPKEQTISNTTTSRQKFSILTPSHTAKEPMAQAPRGTP